MTQLQTKPIDQRPYEDLSADRISELHRRVTQEGCAITNKDFTILCHMAHKYLESKNV